MQIPHYLARSAAYFGDQPAVLFGDEVLSHRALHRRTNQLAHALLGLGLRKGDRVAVQAWNSPRIVEFECALYKAGLVRVPINARQTAAETLDLLDDAGARALLADAAHVDLLDQHGGDLSALAVRVCFDGGRAGWQGYEDLLARASDAAPAVALADDDLAVLHYSSGSTGKLKAAMQTYGNRKAGLRNVLMGNPAGAQPGDTVLMMGPLTHATGVLMQPFLACGAALRVYDKFDLDRMFVDVTAAGSAMPSWCQPMLNMMMGPPRRGPGRLQRPQAADLRRRTHRARPHPRGLAARGPGADAGLWRLRGLRRCHRPERA